MAQHDASFIMDAAQYIVEPPDLWTARVPSKHRDQAPKVVSMPDGGEGWAFEGGAWLRPLGLEVSAGKSPVDIKEFGYSYGDIRQGMYDPKERLADMDLDKVDAASVFPTFGLELRNIRDEELHVACVQAYNEGLWEWTRQADGARLVPHALVPAVGMEAAMAELQRVADMGYKGIIFPGWPAAGDKPQSAEDPFWSLCQEAGIVVNLLRGGPLGQARTPVAPGRYIGPQGSDVRAVDLPLEVILAQGVTIKNLNLSWIVMTGVLDRFPSLKIALIDSGAGWLPTCGELFDWMYRYQQFMAFADLKHWPSDYLRRQVRATVKGEPRTMEARGDIGVERLMWSSNYPNSTSSWPTSRTVIEELFRGVPDAERKRMIGENCAELYGAAPREPVSS